MICNKPHDAVDTGLQRAAGVTTKHVNVKGLQEVHKSSVDLGQEPDSEDDRKAEDEEIDEVSKYLEIGRRQPRVTAIQTEACKVLVHSRVDDKENDAADNEVDWSGEDGDGVITVSWRAGVWLD